MILTNTHGDPQYLNEAFIISVKAEQNKLGTLYTVEMSNGHQFTTDDERFAAYLKP
jgi:hypothetical protein